MKYKKVFILFNYYFNLRDGKGTLVFSNGDSFVGEWKNDLKYNNS